MHFLTLVSIIHTMASKSTLSSPLDFDSAAVENRALQLCRERLETESFRVVAERCQVSHSWLIRWERGEITDPGIHRIGRVLERLSQ